MDKTVHVNLKITLVLRSCLLSHPNFLYWLVTQNKSL